MGTYGRNLLHAAGKVGWMKATSGATKKGMAALGEKVAGSFVGKGFKAGLGTGGAILPLSICGDGWGPHAAACKVTAIVVFAGLITMDLVFITYPMLMMMVEGHRTSSDMKDKQSKSTYIGDGSVIYADPPNCASDIQNLDWPKEIGGAYADKWEGTKSLFSDVRGDLTGDSWSWYDYIPGSRIFRGIIDALGYLGPLFGELAHAFPGYECTQSELDTPVRHHLETEGECYEKGGSCPNVYIAKKEFPGWTFFKGFTIAGFEGAITSCGLIGMARVRAGIICYLSTYSALAIAMMTYPEWMVPWFTGCNIYPHDEWWYADSPVEIEFTKNYDSETGLQEVNIYAAAQ